MIAWIAEITPVEQNWRSGPQYGWYIIHAVVRWPSFTLFMCLLLTWYMYIRKEKVANNNTILWNGYNSKHLPGSIWGRLLTSTYCTCNKLGSFAKSALKQKYGIIRIEQYHKVYSHQNQQIRWTSKIATRLAGAECAHVTPKIHLQEAAHVTPKYTYAKDSFHLWSFQASMNAEQCQQ
jgi:hypothetical protein